MKDPSKILIYKLIFTYKKVYVFLCQNSFNNEFLFILGKKKKKGNLPHGAVGKNLPADAGTEVWSLVPEDPTCCGATELVLHNN